MRLAQPRNPLGAHLGADADLSHGNLSLGCLLIRIRFATQGTKWRKVQSLFPSVNEPIGPLAHLQIGRAYAMQSDIAKTKAAYQDFLTLWKDADPDIPILISAKAEYTKLK